MPTTPVLHPRHANVTSAQSFYSAALWRRAFKYSMVRNPYARAVSWWAMWNAGECRGPGVAGLLESCGCLKKCSFDHFLAACHDKIADNAGEYRGIGVPQLHYLTNAGAPAQLLVDYVGRQEELESHLAAVVRKAGNPPGVARSCAHALPHEEHGSTHADYRTYYGRPETRALADRLFETRARTHCARDQCTAKSVHTAQNRSTVCDAGLRRITAPSTTPLSRTAAPNWSTS